MSVGAALALGVGAKLYPVVLAPLLLWSLARRVNFKTSLLAAVVFATTSLTVLWPMFPDTSEMPVVSSARSLDLNDASATHDDDQPLLLPAEVSTEPRDPSESLRAFLGRWEMNDILFLLVIENLRPSSGLPPEQVAWFRDRSRRKSRLFRDGPPRHRASQTKPLHAASRDWRTPTTKRSRPITQQPSREQQETSFSADSARLMPLRCSSCPSASPDSLSDRFVPNPANIRHLIQTPRSRQRLPNRSQVVRFASSADGEERNETAAAMFLSRPGRRGETFRTTAQ